MLQLVNLLYPKTIFHCLKHNETLSTILGIQLGYLHCSSKVLFFFLLYGEILYYIALFKKITGNLGKTNFGSYMYLANSLLPPPTDNLDTRIYFSIKQN